MTSLNHDIKDKLRNLSVFEKIIGLNVLVYFLGWILRLARKLPRGTSTLDWLELPRDLFDFIMAPWSIITYGFTHYRFYHLLFNMLVLYFVARTMSNLFSKRQGLNIYFLGIIVGGFSYLTVFNILPDNYTRLVGPLVGASAGVRALLLFICAYMPYRQARFFTINIKLWYIGAVLVAFDVIGLFGPNFGGNVAHLGGSALGYFYATQLQKGKDIGEGFGRLMDRFMNLFSSKSNLKTVHKKKKKTFAGHNKQEFSQFNKQKKIDTILDKISKSGYDSLTKAEKEFLFKAGKD